MHTHRPSPRGVRRALAVTAGIALALAAAPSAGARPTAPAAPPCPRPCPIPVAAIQAELDAAVAAGAPGIAVAVRGGRRLVVLTAGEADVAHHRPMRPRDRFRIASITKMMVATAVLGLVEEHRLGLDDPVARWLPDAVDDPRITVRQLLQHASGLYDFGDDGDFIGTALASPERRWAPAELVAIAGEHPPYFAPGAGFHYSNTGFVLLGMLIERVTGEPEPRVLRERIFRPLGLADTYVAQDDRILGRHAIGYTRGDDGSLVDTTRINATLTGASGDVISTVRDVARFQHALLSGRLIGPAMLREMLAFAPVDDPPVDGYGLGIFSSPLPCGVSIGHGGGIFGYSSEANERADLRRQSVAFVNSDSIPDAAYPHLALAAQLALCGA